jgi:RNA polymerase sigma factor (sigma-70 family)
LTTDSNLIDRLAARDPAAWDEVVATHAPTMWVVARSCRLNQADAADAVQYTWTALTEHLPRITEPDRLRAWLVTTVRRESLRIKARRAREHSAESLEDSELDPDHGPEPLAMDTVRDRALRRAFDALPARCRVLLALQANAPELSYAQVAASLEMNAASVGHTKTRCLAHLRRLLERVEAADALTERA